MKLRYLGTFAAAGILAAACAGTPGTTTRPSATGGAPSQPAASATAAAPSATAAAPSATAAAPSATAAAPSATAAEPSATTSGGGNITEVKIGVDLPLSGGEVANGVPTQNGVILAVEEWNELGHDYTVELDIRDDAVNGVHNEQQGATNVQALSADETVVGMVGPFNSSVARAEIPITNEFGLAQCSPANTGVDLTKEGSEVYRPANPDVRNYFRVATPDDVQGPANGQFAYNDLEARNALVIDDTEAFGVGVANSFTEEFEALGGTVVQRQSNDFTVNQSFSAILTGAPEFDVVFFGGTQVTGGGQLRRDMGSAGLLDIPFVGPDGTTDLRPGGTEGAMITLAGIENSENIYGTVAGANALELPQAAEFNAAYEERFGEPPGAYSALAYMCTEVLLQALDANIGSATDYAALREAVRAHVFAGEPFETVLGEVNFDENGDVSQKWISFYQTDVTANEGAGGWVFIKQQDFSVPVEPGESPAASPGEESPAASAGS